MAEMAFEAPEQAEPPKAIIRRVGVGALGKRTSGWYGMLTLILTEAFLFAYLLFSYYYMEVQYGRSWLPEELPHFKLSGPNTAILILSSVAAWLGERAARKGQKWRLFAGLFASLVLGMIFVAIQIKEWLDKPYSLDSHSYGSLYFTVTGFHMAHVLAGLVVLAVLCLWSALGYFDSERHAQVSIGAVYWHFVDVVWLAVFFTFYVTPYLS